MDLIFIIYVLAIRKIYIQLPPADDGQNNKIRIKGKFLILFIKVDA